MTSLLEIARDAKVRDTLEGIRLAHQDMSGVVRGMFGAECDIDEMAMLFGSGHMLALFVGLAVRQEGYTLFNTADDVVETYPLRSGYRAHYWFLTTPHGYRLELMNAEPGSPLHDNMLRQMTESDAAPVHASFKVDSEVNYAIANGTLQQGGYECVQRCNSAYGRFGYWQHSGNEGPAEWYLKPRVNLRDNDAYSDDELEALEEQAAEAFAASDHNPLDDVDGMGN